MIISLLAQYELLERTAHHLSTLDLFHLALTCTDLYKLIRESDAIFERLKREALCDGHGLSARQNFSGLYAPDYYYHEDGHLWKCLYDEELEIRVWNRKCDAADALPCLKCGVNVCEECRYFPRVKDGPYARSRRRPHLLGSAEITAIICYCAACDEEPQNDLSQSLSEYCDCDQYTRWICLPCKTKENQADSQYLRSCTKGDWDLSYLEEGRNMIDHQWERAFWCPCGKRAPKDGNVRCAWCKKRHNMLTWLTDMRNHRSYDIPFFDDDPCFPKKDIGHDEVQLSLQPITYPTLAYSGPIAP